MTYLKMPFSLGKTQLYSNVWYSPLAGCSDLPFRRMSAKYRPGLIFCEMVKMDAVMRYDCNTFRILDYEKDMHPIGGQLVGNKMEFAGPAARIIEDLGFGVVDFNCGCPVAKVTEDGGGSGLLKHPERIGELLLRMVEAVDIPVTVKIRAGWSDELIVAEKVTRIAEEAGAKAISIHGRTRVQAYKGKANWDYIKAAKEAAREIKVIGNGDVFDAEAAEKMFEYTGCDGVLVSRGTMGMPWLAEDIYRRLQGQDPLKRSLGYVKKAFLEHFRYSLEYYNDARAVVDARRLGIWYFRQKGKIKAFRNAITKVQTPQDVYAVIDEFFGEDNGSET